MMPRAGVCLSGVLVIGGIVASPQRGALPSGDPRPAAALRVEIDAWYYSDKLGRELTALRGILEDSAFALLEREFAFVNWRPRSAPPDTVVLRWVHPRGQTIQLNLQISVAGAAKADAGIFDRTFEDYRSISRRSDWRTASVAAAWFSRLQEVVDAERSRLVWQIIGALPMHASVDLKIDSLLVYVAADRDSMKAPRGALFKFRVRTMLHDSDEACQVHLRMCEWRLASATYRCRIESVKYLGEAIDAAEIAGLLARVDPKQRTVHLVEYRPRSLLGEPMSVGDGP